MPTANTFFPEAAPSLPGHSYSPRTHRYSAASFFFLFGFCFASWASRIPAIQQKLHLSETALGIVLFALPAGLLVSLPLSGWLVDRKGSKVVISFAGIAYSCVLVTLGLANSTPALVSALFCFGLAGNMGNISINTQAVGVERLYRRNIMASFHGIWSLAGFAGAAFGTFMNGAGIIPPLHFAIVLGICLTIFLVAGRFLLQRDLQAAEKRPLFALPDRSLLSLGLIAFCSMLCEGAMFDWSGIYFKKVVQVPPALVGAGYTAFMCTMALSRFVADYFTSRFGFTRILQASGLITFTGLILAVALPSFYPAVVGFLLVGVGVSSIVPLVYSAAGRSKKMSAGAALASVSTISFFGFLFGPPLIGILAGISGLRLSFTIIACMGLMITVLATISNSQQKTTLAPA